MGMGGRATSADDLHEAAMRYADEGVAARKHGDEDAALRAFAAATDSERRAAQSSKTEPSRGILYRSAAWLALEAQVPSAAEQSARAGLESPDLSDRVANELRAVLAAAEAATR